MELEGSLPHLKVPANYPHPEHLTLWILFKIMCTILFIPQRLKIFLFRFKDHLLMSGNLSGCFGENVLNP